MSLPHTQVAALCCSHVGMTVSWNCMCSTVSQGLPRAARLCNATLLVRLEAVSGAQLHTGVQIGCDADLMPIL